MIYWWSFSTLVQKTKRDETIFVRIGKIIIVVDKHDITHTFKISNIGWREQK
jgi:hypothetical protein